MTIAQSIGGLLVRGAYALGYDAAQQNRHTRNLSFSRSRPQAEDNMLGQWDRVRLRQRCLDLRRNNPVVAAVVECMSDNVVGSAINPQAKTLDTAWNEQAEAFWREWSKVCDIRQRCRMADFQRLAVHSRMLAGDVLFVILSNGQLQPIEGERIVTPLSLRDKSNVVDGIRVDPKTGIAVGYYIMPRTADGVVDEGSKDFDYIRREDAIYLARPAFRVDQLRGIPDLAPVVITLEHLRELTESTLEKARLDAMQGWAVTSSQSGIGPGSYSPNMVDNGAGYSQYEKFESGMTHYLRPGEDVRPLNGNTPNSQYDSFVTKTLRLTGAALRLPYEFVAMDFSQGNFSSSRAALLQAYRTFSGWQEWLAGGFLQRVWNWRIAKAIKDGVLPPAPVNTKGISQWYQVEWSYPEFQWVDPQAEAQAEQLAFNMGATTLSAIVRKKGRDAEDVLREKGNDIAAAERIAQEINAEHGTKLTWRDLISTLMPGQNPSERNVEQRDKKVELKKQGGADGGE